MFARSFSGAIDIEIPLSPLPLPLFLALPNFRVQREIHDIVLRPETAAGPDRARMFQLGLHASLIEGMESYLYMFALGGAYEAKHLPLPAVLGEGCF